MSRIRTVKPELFRHEDLFDAELTSGLPLRLAFIGLFTVADCKGRFNWKPRTLKLDVLPHDIVDFTAVLDALERHGFIRSYIVDGTKYGLIITFTKHQRIQTKEMEAGSALPDPPDLEEKPENTQVRTGCVPENTQVRTGTRPEFQEEEEEGKRKGRGKEEKRARAPKTPCPADLAITPELQTWADQHGYRDLAAHLERFKDKAIAKGYQYADWNAALRNAIRDDWAGLRKPAPPHDRPPPTANARAAHFDALLRNLNHPVIEGELARELH